MKAIAGTTAALAGPGSLQVTTQEPEDYGKNNRNLPTQLVNAITEVIKEAQLEDRWWRLQEVLRASLCRYYDLGIQHLWCDGYNWMQAIPGQSYTNGDGEVDSFPDYIGDYNIFTAFAQIVQAKISEPDIGIDFQPIRMDRSVDRQAAEAANAIRTQADIDHDPHEIMTEKIYFLEMDGTAVTWAGTKDQQDDFGGEDGPRRVTFRDVGGVLEWKRPLFAQSVSEWWYAIHYRDTDIKIESVREMFSCRTGALCSTTTMHSQPLPSPIPPKVYPSRTRPALSTHLLLSVFTPPTSSSLWKHPSRTSSSHPPIPVLPQLSRCRRVPASGP